MDSFSSSSTSSNGSSGQSTEVLMDQLKAQLAQAYAEEFLESNGWFCYRYVLNLDKKRTLRVIDLLLNELDQFCTVSEDNAVNASNYLLQCSHASDQCLLDHVENLQWRTEISTVRSKCFAKCITKPGTSLSGSESSCISRCVDRYIEATGIISRALFSSPR